MAATTGRKEKSGSGPPAATTELEAKKKRDGGARGNYLSRGVFFRAQHSRDKATVTTAARARPRRSDAGHVKLSARDLELLRFVGEQYAVTLPQLARLMGRTVHAARWLRARWVRRSESVV